MSTKANDFKIGLFTFIGIGLLVTGLLVFGAWSNFQKTSLFETYLEGDASGLSVGSAVELGGVRVGKVTSIDFSWKEYPDNTPGLVVVVFEINDNVSDLPPGARYERFQAAVDHGLRARPKAQGVTGTCIMSLEYVNPAEYPAIKVPWTPRHTYIPSAPGLLGDLLVSMQKALHKLDHTDIAALDQIAETDLKSLGRLLARVERMDLEGLSTNANALLAEARTSNTKLQSLIANTDDTMKRMQLEKLSHDADAMINTLTPGLAKLDFDSVNQTLENAQRTLHELDDVLFELKQYPSGFLFGKPPPAPRQIQPSAKQ